jgi:Arc/MetJ-type ribon-helix-helix transcriptional regulator
MLSKDKISGNIKYSSISDFVNQAIKEKLAKEAKK